MRFQLDPDWLGTYFVIHFDAGDRCGETKLSAITIAVRIGVRLNGIHVGRCQNSIVVEHMVQHEFADTSCIGIVVVDTVPNANVTIAASCDHVPIPTKIDSKNS